MTVKVPYLSVIFFWCYMPEIFDDEIFNGFLSTFNKAWFPGRKGTAELQNGEMLEVLCPATTTQIGRIPLMGVKETRAAIAVAKPFLRPMRLTCLGIK